MRKTTGHVTLIFTVFFAAVLAALDVSAHPGSGIALDSQGQVYFVHTGVGVFRVEHMGRLVRHEGPGFHFMIIDREQHFVRQHWPRFPDGEIQVAGTSPKLLLASSFPLVVGLTAHSTTRKP